jgi:hypothetical protein
VDLEEPVLRLLEDERERLVPEVRPEPRELAPAPVDARLELGGEAVPDPAVRAVRGKDEVGVPPRLERIDLGLVDEPRPEGSRAVPQYVQEQATAHPAEAVARSADALSFKEDVDVGPVREGLPDLGVALGVGLREVRERLVREHDPPAERIVRPVALEDRDLVPGIELLDEDREVEAGRTAADDDDPQAPAPCRSL